MKTGVQIFAKLGRMGTKLTLGKILRIEAADGIPPDHFAKLHGGGGTGFLSGCPCSIYRCCNISTPFDEKWCRYSRRNSMLAAACTMACSRKSTTSSFAPLLLELASILA